MPLNNPRFCLSLLLLAATLGAASAQTNLPDPAREARLGWWREARFGMFIHWGLYALPAGEWKGRPIPGIGEWIMNRARIPIPEYEQLARQFNPVKFNADEWVAVAASAGARYIVITSKHHDGFAMYQSKVDKYNIVDASPFGRDPMKELAAACQKAGIRLCFYYSQAQDWHDPDAAGNNWDFPDESKKDFAKYFERKCKPQVREILTQYGPIGLIWYDTPRVITSEQSHELAQMTHQLQPQCIVSGRVGHGAGDYDSAGDNQISVGVVQRDMETPVTMNDTWGFKKDDHNWKSTAVLIRQLVQIASRGGNYLLNVGPTAEGLIPQPSVQRMGEIGKWLRANSEAINGTQPSPFPYELSWGIITRRPGKLYLHMFEWPGRELVLHGIKSKVQQARLLAGGQVLRVEQKREAAIDHDIVTIRLPERAPDANDSVIALDFADREPRVETSLVQQPDRSVMLPAHLAKLNKGSADTETRLDSRGVFERWLRSSDWVEWDFKLVRPGEYDVVVLSSTQKNNDNWEGGHRLVANVAGQALAKVAGDDGREVNPANPYWKYVQSKMGSVKIANAGQYHVTLKPETITADKKLGFTLVGVKLIPR